MPDYRVVADSEVQPDAPVTSSLGFALRDNPAAIAQGADGAPKVRSPALNLTTAAGDRESEGVFFTINNIDRISTFMVNSYVVIVSSFNASTATRYRTSTNGGATWSGYTIFNTTVVTSGGTNSSTKFGFVTTSSSVNSIQFDMTITSGSAGAGSLSVLGIRGVSP